MIWSVYETVVICVMAYQQPNSQLHLYIGSAINAERGMKIHIGAFFASLGPMPQFMTRASPQKRIYNHSCRSSHDHLTPRNSRCISLSAFYSGRENSAVFHVTNNGSPLQKRTNWIFKQGNRTACALTIP